jgi:ferrochelatase
MRRPTGICLLYMGGPERLEDVEPFLLELFSDRELIRLPGGGLLQRPLARFIARRRAPRVRRRYARIGGGSPLIRITTEQARLLQEALDRRGDYHVEVAMRYSEPRADRAVAGLLRREVTRCVALPLYPHYSAATTGSSFKDLERAHAAAGARFEIERITSFHDHPGYLDALAGRVQAGLDELGTRTRPHVVFSAHSLPRRLVERGDPYQRQVEATVAGVVARLQLSRWRLGYQSRSGPVRWLEPDVLDLIADLARRGERQLLVVPVSFVSDHIETLHEIDIEMREYAEERGVESFVRAPALNDERGFIEALAELAATGATS